MEKLESEPRAALRTAVHLPGPAPTAEKLALARHAAARGVTEFWLSEDMFYRGALSTAASVATEHPTATIGLGVITPYGRHPAVTAMDLRVLDDLSQHLIVGLGAGVGRRIRDLGEDWGSPLARVGQAVEDFRRYLSMAPDERLRADAPPACPVPPIYVAATGEKMLSLAGTIGDGLICTLMSSVAHVRYASERFGNAAVDAGRSEPIDVVAYLPLFLRGTHQEAIDEARPLVGHLVRKWGKIPNLARLFSDWGPLTDDELARLADRLEADPHDWGTVPDELVDAMCVAGDAAGCRRRLDAYEAAGLRCAVFDPGTEVTSPGEFVEQLSRLQI